MKKFFTLCLLSSLFFLINGLATVRAHPPGEKQRPAADEEKSDGPKVGKAKPSEARGTPPELLSEPKPVSSSKAPLYKWKDDKGQWRFSDHPPAGVNAQKVGGIQ